MFGAISRRLVTGGALLLAAFLAADAAEIDDDLPDLADQIAQMASEVALELQQICPPASPSDQAAFDRCRRSLFGDSALRRSLAPRLLWGRRNQDAGAELKNTNLTQFAPDVIAGLYLSLFMYSGEYSTEYVERERLYLIRLRAGFRNLLPPGQFPYPFWHDEAKWGVYQAANSVLLWVNPKTAKIVIGQFTERGSDSPVVSTQPIWPKFDGNWMWMDKEGRIQPRVTLFDGLFRQDNPYLPKLDFTYRTLALRMRDAQCDKCHAPNNPLPMRRLVLMHTPAHAAGEIARLMTAVREDRMPRDDNGIEQPLEPALKRALLESGGAFEELVKAAKDWEASHRD
ncbi:MULTISPECIES: hypothetical protein [Bradyrhizobium]|jgi:hypothetical protein|uniref:Uncharacterized protein n=2 Tax=Bradyrhizobium TaxID=374 RepID=A0ABY0Q4Y0_9BRAD|nr:MULTISPECIES: hypothetical protein [Bradyrhizobium]SDJ49813.1 hypothetical protein SAMN05444163_5578 [Bradyrhizobium ottawaense]SEC50855.1 hypothetical protein SAMN05444171_1581 [Bradyrhizobium lablabi]SHK70600.1 hypothetical protein SAMN05444321_0411 [Bradyrhizobium lablabi]